MISALRSRSAIALGIIALVAFVGLQLVGHRHVSASLDDRATIAAEPDTAHGGADHECGACAIAGVTTAPAPPLIADPRIAIDVVRLPADADYPARPPLAYAPKTSPPANA
jgi:hypothetical protein